MLFNFGAVFALSWFYLHGFKDLKRWLGARRTKKAAAGESE